MRTNTPTETLSSPPCQLEIKPTDILRSYPDSIRYIHDTLTDIDTAYAAYSDAKHTQDYPDTPEAELIKQRNDIDHMIIGLSEVFQTYQRQKSQDEPSLRLDVNQLHTFARLTDDMKADTEHTPAYLGDALDDTLGTILTISVDADDPGDRDYLFTNAYARHREHNTPITDEYNKLVDATQLFLPDGENALYQRHDSDCNHESVELCLERAQLCQIVTDYALHHDLINHNKKIRAEWLRQKAADDELHDQSTDEADAKQNAA